MEPIQPTQLAAIAGIVTIIVGAATAYLRLFVANQMALVREQIQKDMKEEYATADFVRAEIKLLRAELKLMRVSE